MAEYDPVESPDASTIFPYHELTPPTIRDVHRARSVVRQHLPKTPLVRAEWLSSELNADVYLKREDTLPTGAFKVRGGVNLAAALSEEFQNTGLIAASTGNHGQSVAYAGRTVDVPVIIGVPEGANPSKIEAMRRLGARVEEQGQDFDAAREWVEEQATREGYRYVHSANEPTLIAGVGTAGLEVLEDLPSVDVVFTPVGGGSNAAGYSLTVGNLGDADVIGVQSSGADAVYQAWANDHLDPASEMDTFVEGLATRVPFALTTRMLRERLSEFVRVSDSAIREAMRNLLEHEHIATEGAGATGVAGMFACRDEIEGRTVVAPITGGNIGMEQLQALINK